ncbi:MAG: O-antigen ligase family protein [Aureliella sp.]
MAFPIFGSSKTHEKVPLPVLALILGFATPPEMSLDLGGLRLSPYRIVVIAMLIPCLVRIFGKRAAAWHLGDTFMLLHCMWVLLALIAYAGLGQGIESGGIYLFEAMGGYLVGRCLIKDARQFLAVSRLMLSVVLCFMCIAALESVSGNHFIRQASRTVLGGPPLPAIEPRLGLHRAFVSFDHPILYGIFCASTLGMAVYIPMGPADAFASRFRPAISAFATFFSLSSGAFSALGAQLFLVGWDKVTRGIGHRWSILGGGILSIWTVITLLSNRGPVKVFLTYFTFSPGTGYNRLRIWEYGSAEVIRHPIFGIGLGDWERPAWMVSGSMDNFWLATAVRYGVPALIFLVAAIGYLVYRQVRVSTRQTLYCKCRSAWMVSIIGLSLAACTVHFWNALFCLFCFLIGSGAWLASGPTRERNRRFR